MLERIWILGALLTTGAAACDISVGPDMTEARRGPSPLQSQIAIQTSGPLSLDDRFAAVANRNPLFAGMYFDDAMRLNVVVTDLERARADLPGLRMAISAVFNAPRYSNAAIALREGRHSWKQLYEWGKALPRVGGAVREVVSGDIDEVNNRLTIGIRTDDARAAVEAELQRLGVPLEVV